MAGGYQLWLVTQLNIKGEGGGCSHQDQKAREQHAWVHRATIRIALAIYDATRMCHESRETQEIQETEYVLIKYNIGSRIKRTILRQE